MLFWQSSNIGDSSWKFSLKIVIYCLKRAYLMVTIFLFIWFRINIQLCQRHLQKFNEHELDTTLKDYELSEPDTWKTKNTKFWIVSVFLSSEKRQSFLYCQVWFVLSLEFSMVLLGYSQNDITKNLRVLSHFFLKTMLLKSVLIYFTFIQYGFSRSPML